MNGKLNISDDSDKLNYFIDTFDNNDKLSVQLLKKKHYTVFETILIFVVLFSVFIILMKRHFQNYEEIKKNVFT